MTDDEIPWDARHTAVSRMPTYALARGLDGVYQATLRLIPDVTPEECARALDLCGGEPMMLQTGALVVLHLRGAPPEEGQRVIERVRRERHIERVVCGLEESGDDRPVDDSEWGAL